MSEKQDDGKWIPCPICESKTRVKVNPDTVLLHFPLFCPKCKNVTRIDVIQLQMTLSGE